MAQAPAVVFANVETGVLTIWQIPNAFPEFAVSPSGTFLVWREALSAGGLGPPFLLRTDAGRVRRLPPLDVIEMGARGAGFIARHADGALVVYDGQGRPVRTLAPASSQPLTAWSSDGSRIAVADCCAADSSASLTIQTLSGSGDEPADFERPEAVIGLEWSPDGANLAVVTSSRISVVTASGAPVWELRLPTLLGNPRWSADGRHLTVMAQADRAAGGAPLTYLISLSGEVRYRAVGAIACGDDPWLADGETFRAFGNAFYLLSIDGRVEQTATEVYGSPTKAEAHWFWRNTGDAWEAVVTAPDSPPQSVARVQVSTEIGFHLVHVGPEFGGDLVAWTEDGSSIIFSTPGVGHGGCAGHSFSFPVPDVRVESPPFN